MEEKMENSTEITFNMQNTKYTLIPTLKRISTHINNAKTELGAITYTDNFLSAYEVVKTTIDSIEKNLDSVGTTCEDIKTWLKMKADAFEFAETSNYNSGNISYTSNYISGENLSGGLENSQTYAMNRLAIIKYELPNISFIEVSASSAKFTLKNGEVKEIDMSDKYSTHDIMQAMFQIIYETKEVKFIEVTANTLTFTFKDGGVLTIDMSEGYSTHDVMQAMFQIIYETKEVDFIKVTANTLTFTFKDGGVLTIDMGEGYSTHNIAGILYAVLYQARSFSFVYQDGETITISGVGLEPEQPTDDNPGEAPVNPIVPVNPGEDIGGGTGAGDTGGNTGAGTINPINVPAIVIEIEEKITVEAIMGMIEEFVSKVEDIKSVEVSESEVVITKIDGNKMTIKLGEEYSEKDKVEILGKFIASLDGLTSVEITDDSILCKTKDGKGFAIKFGKDFLSEEHINDVVSAFIGNEEDVKSIKVGKEKITLIKEVEKGKTEEIEIKLNKDIKEEKIIDIMQHGLADRIDEKTTAKIKDNIISYSLKDKKTLMVEVDKDFSKTSLDKLQDVDKIRKLKEEDSKRIYPKIEANTEREEPKKQ